MVKYKQLFDLAHTLAANTHGFLDSKGPGIGNHATNQFVTLLAHKAQMHFGADFSEQKICGDTSLAVDYYFPDEGVIVEVALGLSRPNSEFEKDILKALIAKDLGYRVEKLVFFAKPGGVKKCQQPGRSAVKQWLHQQSGIVVEVYDF
ncbi:hypothetical protein [uncultured Ferrimonas sp.]|uniref:hypothetical protein n=1 Tax=uncultured Ferrimonas sp. TaxID=432640 RepID=UPI002623785F|nr:hypothetical protein [uncultured Ferrimonas sp.]